MTSGRKPKPRPETLPQDPDRERQRREELGRRLRECRESRAWSLRDLAARSGLHRNEILSLEGGMVDARVGTIARLAEALDCQEAWLLYGRSLKD